MVKKNTEFSESNLFFKELADSMINDAEQNDRIEHQRKLYVKPSPENAEMKISYWPTLDRAYTQMNTTAEDLPSGSPKECADMLAGIIKKTLSSKYTSKDFTQRTTVITGMTIGENEKVPGSIEVLVKYAYEPPVNAIGQYLLNFRTP